MGRGRGALWVEWRRGGRGDGRVMRYRSGAGGVARARGRDGGR